MFRHKEYNGESLSRKSVVFSVLSAALQADPDQRHQ